MAEKSVVLLWYHDGEQKGEVVDVQHVNSWEGFRGKAKTVTQFKQSRMDSIVCQNRDGVDLEKKISYSDFWEGAGDLFKEVLLVHPDDITAKHDFGRTVRPELQVQVLEATLSHVRPVTALMEAIENSMEAIRWTQRHGKCKDYKGQVSISLKHSRKEIEIRDNGRGMADSDVRNAVNYGRLKNRAPAESVITAKEWQTGDFGKYGIGLFTLFRFGKDVTIQIDSKKDHMRERMVSAVIDYRQMRAQNKFEIEKISNPVVDKGIFPNETDHGTRILISRVSDEFWDSCTTTSSHELKDELKREIAEKYCLYTDGMGQLKKAMLAQNVGNDPGLWHGMDTLPTIDIVIDDHPIKDEDDENRVLDRISSMCQCDGTEEADDTGNTLAKLKAKAKKAAATSRASREVPTRDDSELAGTFKPCFYKALEMKTRNGNVSATAHVILFYNPVVSGVIDLTDSLGRDGPQVMVFWQELFFREENSQLPFMVKALEKAKKERKADWKAPPDDAFSRVKGFLFLDLNCAPDANKTIVAKSGDLRHELFGLDSQTCNDRKYQKLVDEYHDQVKRWNIEYDRMDTYHSPHIEVPDADLLRWHSVTKRQEVRSQGKSVNIKDITYKAEWLSAGTGECTAGDFIEIRHPEDGRRTLAGQLRHLQTRKSDGFYPTNGTLVLMRPFEGIEREFCCSLLLKKLDHGQVKTLTNEIKARLPHFLSVSQCFRDENGAIGLKKIEQDECLSLSQEDASTFQLTIDVMNSKKELLTNIGLDRTQILLPENIVVKLELFQDRPDFEQFQVNEPKVKSRGGENPWEERVSPYDYGQSRFNTSTTPLKKFTTLGEMLQIASSRGESRYLLKLSLTIVDKSAFEEDSETEEHPFRGEFLDHISSLSFNCTLEMTAGKPSKLQVKTRADSQLCIWFGLDIHELILVFKDRSDNVIPCSVLSSTRNQCAIRIGAKDEVLVDMVPGEDGQHFCLQKFRIDQGWALQRDQRLVLRLEATVKHKGVVMKLNGTIDAQFMSGVPSKIEVAGHCFERVLPRRPAVKSKLLVLDEWGNQFRGMPGQVSASVEVTKHPWIRGRDGSDSISVHDVVEGMISFGDPSSMMPMQIEAPYGGKGTIKFSCRCMDRRQSPETRRLKSVHGSVEFEIESAELRFVVPEAVKEKCSTKVSAEEYGIEIDYSVHDDVGRKALHGIHVQLVDSVSKAICTNHVTDQQLILKRISSDEILSMDIDDENDTESEDEAAESTIDLKKGKSLPLDKVLLTTKSCKYVASFDGLEATLVVHIKPGSPATLSIKTLPQEVKLGVPFDLVWKALDKKGIMVRDLSVYDIEIRHDESLTLKSTMPKRLPSGLWCYRGLVLEGTLPTETRCTTYRVTISISNKSNVSIRSQTAMGQDARCDVEFALQVCSGAAKRLRLVTQAGFAELSCPTRFVSGDKLGFFVQAVDAWDNIDWSSKQRFKVTLEDELSVGKDRMGALSDGECEITFGSWFTRSTKGCLKVQPLSGRLECSEYELDIVKGTWPAALVVVAPREPAVIDDDCEELQNIQIQVVADDGTVVAPERFEVYLTGPSQRQQTGRKEGMLYVFDDCVIPKEPGDYNLSFMGKNAMIPSLPTSVSALTVTRTRGKVHSLEISSGETMTATAHDEQQITLQVKNKLGVPVGLLDCEIRFSLKPEENLVVESRSVSSALSDSLVYSLKFKERGAALRVPRDLVVELWQAGACISAKRIALTFIPESVITGNQQETLRIYNEINQLESKRTNIENEEKKFRAHKSKCEQALQAALRQVVKFSQEDERDLATCRIELDKLRRHHPARAECLIKSDSLKNAKRFYPDIPFVFELGQVHVEHDSKAINALVGSRLLAAVTATEREKEDIVRDKRFSGLCCVSLENIRTVHPNRASPPPNARYAADLVREVRPQYRALWDDLLKDSLVFETEDAMAEYKRRNGYGRYLAAQRADGSWRTVKGIWEVAGDTPKQYVQLAGVPLEESNDYAIHKSREVELLNKQRQAEESARTVAAARAAVEAVENCRPKSEITPAQLQRDIDALKARLTAEQKSSSLQLPVQAIASRKRAGSPVTDETFDVRTSVAKRTHR